MTVPTPPAVSDAMREAVAPVTRAEVRACIGPTIPLRRRWVDLLMQGPIARLQAETARLTGERDDAEQRVTNLAAALASAHRARGEQEKRANEADGRRVYLEKDRIHPAFSVEVQEHRQQAYEGGWSDGYAEGFAKPIARAEAAEAETARLRAALEPYRSGGSWGGWLAWLIAGAPDREKGKATAKQIVRWQTAADEALASKDMTDAG
jgi:hypothetical protein